MTNQTLSSAASLRQNANPIARTCQYSGRIISSDLGMEQCHPFNSNLFVSQLTTCYSGPTFSPSAPGNTKIQADLPYSTQSISRNLIDQPEQVDDGRGKLLADYLNSLHSGSGEQNAWMVADRPRASHCICMQGADRQVSHRRSITLVFRCFFHLHRPSYNPHLLER